MIKIQPKLETDRLILRGFLLSDASEVQHMAGLYEIAEMTLNIPHPYETGMAENWIKTHQLEYNSGQGVIFAIVNRMNNQLMGAIGLTIVQRFNRAELGYWIGKSYWGKGYATEAAREILRFGFQELNLNKIYATHMTRNPASGRVMQKIDMKLEGILKQHVLKWDQFLDLATYAILAEEWLRDQQG